MSPSRRHKKPSHDKDDVPQHQVADTQPELKFFLFSDPAEARSPSNKKLVRSHVARMSHAKSRRERCEDAAAGSSTQGAMDNTQYEPAALAWDSSASYYQASPSTMPESPSVVSCGYQSPGPQGQTHYSPGQLSPDEQYLLDHYVNVYIPNSPHNPCAPSDVNLYRHGMTVHWVSFCLTDNDLMQGLFHASCVDLAQRKRAAGNKKDAELCEQRALHYRGRCLRLASEAMPQDGRPLTDKVIGMTLFLAINESAAGDYEQARQHMTACEYMIDLKGGHQTLGLDGFLSQLVIWSRGLCEATAADGKARGKKKAHK